MHRFWHHNAKFAARILTLVIVISLVILPLSMSNARISGAELSDTGSTIELPFANHHGAMTSDKSDDQADIQNAGQEADCENKNLVDADAGNSCCSTFSSAFYISDSYALGTVSGRNAIAPTLVRQLVSGKPEAPHRPPSA